MEACLCGSQKPSDESCIPSVAPIHSDIPRFVRSSKLYLPGTPIFARQIRNKLWGRKGPGYSFTNLSATFNLLF